MTQKTRKEQFSELFPDTPAYRLKQLDQALFDLKNKSWNDVTVLPEAMRQTLAEKVPWISVETATILRSKNGDTHKVVLRLADGKEIESVLMENARGDLTICVSSQVGCAMRCGFCATGTMGFKRNLTADEIVDQYRFWKYFIATEEPVGGDCLHAGGQSPLPSRISNVVFMGMGEPMGNYANVKATLNTWLTQTDLGPTHITVSTVGLLPRLEDILNDAEWPHVRLAVSLHSALAETRKKIVPTSFDDFLPKLAEWGKKYLEKFGNNRHHLTFEYVMLSGVNDTDAHAEELAKYANSIGRVRINVIPYNFTDLEFQKSEESQIQRFIEIVENKGVTITRRRTMGDDIAAACGQLVKKTEPASETQAAA